jgi:RNA repair pathway DNA polymerase beta family protein
VGSVPKGLRGHVDDTGREAAVPTAVHSERLGPMVPIHARDPAQWIADSGMVLRVLVGSDVHGTAIGGQGDRDEMGVCVEPPATVAGLSRFEHYQFRTQPEGACSGPGDLDLIVYSLRKFARLAARGNPTVLLPLFVADEHVCYANELGQELRAHRHRFLSRQAGARFRGYLESQRRGLMGLRSGGTRNQGRADLRERYGFDCYLDDTEFLTRRGWRTYDEIADGEAVATLSTSSGRVEFQVPTERVAKPYSGPIHFVRHRYTECAVTPNHRMWTSPVNRGPSGRIGVRYRPEFADWAFRPMAEVRGHHHVRVVGAPREEEYPVSDPTLALLGCYLSEGSVAKRLTDGSASVLSFTQRVGGRLEPVLSAAAAERPMRVYRYERDDEGRSTPCDYRIYTVADRGFAAATVRQCGERSAEKRLPAWAFDLSARQSEVLLEALMAGDGTRTRGGWQIYYTCSSRLAGDVQALAVLAGRRSNVWGPYPCGARGIGMYQVMVQDPGRAFETVSTRSNLGVRDVVDQRVVCFTVPNETLVTRRNGRVAMHGNTKFAAHMVRLGLQGVELMRTGTITLPVPEPDLAWLRELRQGRRTKEEALARAASLEEEIERLAPTSPLPERPDPRVLDSWLVDLHRRHWGWA